MPIVVIGLSHRTAPVNVRERFAFPDARVPAVLKQLRDSGAASEAVILSTCNRVELYAVTTLEPRAAFPALQDFILKCHDYRDPVQDEFYSLAEPHSLEHLFKVACGLDSMVLGETEILGQLKKAYDLALQGGHSGARLNKAFQKAFNVAKHIRTETNIQRGSVSVGSVAVELAEKIFTSLHGRQAMVIGAGDTSEKTARALLSRGVQSIIVSNRSHERAVELAAELSGRAVHFEEWAAEFPATDIIISSTSAPHYILDRARLAPLLKPRKNRPLLLIISLCRVTSSPRSTSSKMFISTTLTTSKPSPTTISASATRKSSAARPLSATRPAPCSAAQILPARFHRPGPHSDINEPFPMTAFI